jgi:hypothetical protein
MLIKLSAPPYAWVAAHRAEQAAVASGGLRAIADARRDLVSLFHRAGDYGKARAGRTPMSRPGRPLTQFSCDIPSGADALRGA